MLPRFVMLVRIAFANIFSSLLNVFVGVVLLFGSMLLVVGGSLFWTLDGALSRSIVDSITGHLQVYAARSKDTLEVYGKVDGTDANLAPLYDFKDLKRRLLEVPNVARVVPMGAATALVTGGNTIDLTLDKLRALYRDQADPTRSLAPEVFAHRARTLEGHARNIVTVLVHDAEREKELASPDALDAATRDALARAATPEFWDTFSTEAFARLELLENRIAPLVADGDMLFMRCLGTDLDAYQESFDRLTIVEGELVPRGHRGLLLPRYFREEYLKLRSARRLDKLRDALKSGRRLADASDKELQRWVKENQAQTREILLQLDDASTQRAVAKLQALLKTAESDLATLLPSFFAMDDTTFEERFRFFYSELAPMLSLYRANVGDELTLQSFGRAGSIESATVRVYGVFELRGLEKSPLAGANALIDIVTFRDLYGFLTKDRQAELDAMKAAAAARVVSRDTAEAELFGGNAEIVAEVVAAELAPPLRGDVGDEPRERKRRRSPTYAPEEVDDGVVLHAAVLLKDGSEPAQRRAQEAIERVLSADRPPPDTARLAAAKALLTGAPLPSTLRRALSEVISIEESRAVGSERPGMAALLALSQALKSERTLLEPKQVSAIEGLLAAARPNAWVVTWTSAAGFLGKFIDFFRLVLAAVVLAFAFVALIVVTIGMTIATLQRTAMIGVMRAIGAQRGFVVTMVLTETVVLALTFGVAGSALGALVVHLLHEVGIPAFRDELYFFFSGPVLRPELTGWGVVLSVAVTLVVSVLAVAFPTVLASRVAPVTAMQGSE